MNSMFFLCNMKNLVALNIFAVVGKLKSFTKAADQLGLTKSTVSRQIQSLEQDLGVALIQRDPRHFSLTEVGSVLLRRAESIIHQTHEAFDEVTQIQSGLRGAIHISATSDLALIYLAKPIAQFSIQHPEIEFHVDLSPRQVDLKSEGFNMAIRPGFLKDSGLFARKIDETQLMFFASPEYLAKNGRPKSVIDLKNFKMIATGKLKIGKVIINPKMTANNMSLVKQLTLQCAGIGVLGEKMAHIEKKEGHLVQVLTQISLPKVPIYLLFPQRKMPKRISTFAQEILNRKF